MSFTPYLNFDGTTAEAMTFYAGLFGASDLTITRFAEVHGDELPPEFADKVMNATFSFQGGQLMASDYPPGMEAAGQSGVSVAHVAPSKARGQEIFDALAKGGTITMPYEEVMWAEAFGMVRDRFGTHWMINGPMKS